MVNSTVRVILGIVITCGVAVGAVVIGNDSYVDADGGIAKACAGRPATPQLENALFNARSRSEGGTDPICSPAAVDDDLDGSLLSRSPGSRNSAATLGTSAVAGRHR
jgi:hypothetical protein